MGRNHELKLLSLSTFALWGEIRFIAFRDRTRPLFGKTSLGEIAPYLPLPELIFNVSRTAFPHNKDIDP